MKEVVSLIDWKYGLPAGMPPQSNDSSWDKERQLLPAPWLLIPSNLQFPLISSTAGPAGEGTLAQCPLEGSARFVWLVEEREESPSEDGTVLAVQAGDVLWHELAEAEPGRFSQTSQPFPSSAAETGICRE